MFQFINTVICKIAPATLSASKRRFLSIYKWFRYLESCKVYPRSFIFLAPSLPVALTNLKTEILQYDVEENIGHLMTLARIALERGETEKAEAILEMGIKICDEYQSYLAMPYMYDILASIAFAMGRMKRAENLLVQVIEKMVQLGNSETDSQIVDFKLRLARIYSVYNEDSLAELGFRDCLAVQEAKIIDGDTSSRTGMLYINVMFWYGLHKIKEGQLASAKNLIDSAYSYSSKIKGLSPYQEMVILYTLGDLHSQMEEYDMALQNIHSAIVLGKGIGSLDLPRCYLKLGKIYLRLGANSTAEIWLTEAYKLADLFNDKEVSEEAEKTLKEISLNNSSLFSIRK